MFKKILLLLLFTAILSCKNKDSDTPKTTWISGQIVNPKLDYIIFSQGDQILDTLKLDSNNFFLYKTQKIKAGLYSLKHNESQVFYIKPGDSLLIHLNTMDFDESLAYSGRGGQENNLLMDLFLENETEINNLPKWYSDSPRVFERKIDSLKELKIQKIKDFLQNNEVSENFKKVVDANIKYSHYSKKELYAAASAGSHKEIPANFFDFRKNIDFGNNTLRFYYPYYRYLNRYFDNVISSNYNQSVINNRNSYEYNYKKLELIDSLVKTDSLKNSLLRYNIVRYLVNAKNAQEEQKLYSVYSKMTTDEKHREEVKKLADATVKISSGNLVPNILLVNTANIVQDLQSIINSPTVLYFWSAQSVMQFKNIHRRAAELKSKYPEYDFIGINTDSHFKRWRETIEKTGYNSAKEFQLENVSDAQKKLVLNSINKVIILDKKGIILEGNSNMFNNNFEELLLGYLNK